MSERVGENATVTAAHLSSTSYLQLHVCLPAYVERSVNRRPIEGLYCYVIKSTALSAGFVNESATSRCEAVNTQQSNRGLPVGGLQL